MRPNDSLFLGVLLAALFASCAIIVTGCSVDMTPPTVTVSCAWGDPAAVEQHCQHEATTDGVTVFYHLSCDNAPASPWTFTAPLEQGYIDVNGVRCPFVVQ